jgi:hypothetical protein
MNDTLKAAGRIGAELGAAKAENERLRELIEDAGRELQAWVDSFPRASHHQANAIIARIGAALSQKAEPTDTYTAVDMATAAAQGFRDGQAAAEPAPAQDEREAFEAHMRLGGYSNPEKRADGSYVSSAMELWWQGWKARAARRAQTEQQPKEEIPKPDGWVAAGRFFTDRDEAIAAAEKTPCVDVYFRPSLLTVLARSAERQSVAEELARLLSQSNRDIRQLNAAPIAQTAPQGKFRMGDLVKKSSGSEWEGRVVGYYRTEQTQEGYAVESSAHRNSVQIYPAKALEVVE